MKKHNAVKIEKTQDPTNRLADGLSITSAQFLNIPQKCDFFLSLHLQVERNTHRLKLYTLYHIIKETVIMSESTPVATPKAAKKAVAKPKKPVEHPKYAEMVSQGVSSLKERGGSSRQAILKYIMANFKVGNDDKVVNTHLKTALKSSVKNGSLKQSKGTGASGSFKIGEVKKVVKKVVKKPKKVTKPKAAVTKPKAKKTTKAKKESVTTKKAASTPKKAAAKPKKAVAKPKKAAATPKKQATPKKAAAKPKAQKAAAAKPKKAAAKPKKTATKK